MIGILDALISDGPLKGWPLSASIAFQQGASPSEVKKAMILQYERQKVSAVARLDAAIAAVKALPDQVVDA